MTRTDQLNQDKLNEYLGGFELSVMGGDNNL